MNQDYHDDASCAFAPHHAAIRRFLGRYAPRSYGVDDLLHDTLLAAYTTVRNRGPPEKLLPWLLTIAKRQAFHAHARERRHEAHCLQDVVDEDAREPGFYAATREVAGLLRTASRSLPADSAAILQEYYADRLSCSAIGERRGLNASAAKTRLHRARGRLRQTLAAMVAEEFDPQH